MLVGCSKPSDNSNIASHEPVSGAFGWVFGDKLSPDIEVKPDDDGTFYYTYETNGFFRGITVNVNDARQICMIRGYASTTSIGPFDINELVKTLSDKYGLINKAEGEWGRFWDFGNAHEVRLSVMGGQIILLYRYDKLLDPVQQKFEQQKNDKFKKSLNVI